MFDQTTAKQFSQITFKTNKINRTILYRSIIHTSNTNRNKTNSLLVWIKHEHERNRENIRNAHDWRIDRENSCEVIWFDVHTYLRALLGSFRTGKRRENDVDCSHFHSVVLSFCCSALQIGQCVHMLYPFSHSFLKSCAFHSLFLYFLLGFSRIHSHSELRVSCAWTETVNTTFSGLNRSFFLVTFASVGWVFEQ